jgi:transcriptional regulator with XRE-family HTH domain
MRGTDLKAWREHNRWTQGDLMTELEVGSRQTISTWESAQKIPRLVELAIIALDQVEASRKQSGFAKQFTIESIVNRHFERGIKYFNKPRQSS